MMYSEGNHSLISSLPFFPPPFWFEKNFDVAASKQWLDRNYHHCFYYCGGYLVLLSLTIKFMENRPAFKLKWPLVIWNISLALVSTLGMLRTGTEMFYVLKRFGFETSVCQLVGSDENPVLACSTFIFCWLKVIELFDSMFIVLRKQKLIFLHWFHHSTVVVVSVYGVLDRVAICRWIGSINFTLHSLMYSYYALRALGYRIPKWCSMLLTTMQILQMVAGSAISAIVSVKWWKGENCNVSQRMLVISVALHLIFLGLFVNFFIHSYFLDNKKNGKKTA